MKTLAPYSITQTTAVTGGFDITGSITEKGVVYGVSAHPIWQLGISENTSSITTSSTTNFVVQINGLTPNLKYYVRSYVVISNSPVYGSEFSFVTRAIEDVIEDDVCTTKDIEINPGEVYNLPPFTEVIGLVATEAQANALKSKCPDILSIINQLTTVIS